MVFCIGEEKREKLSDIISSVLHILKEDEGIEAAVMNSYIINLHPSPLFQGTGLVDGLNIKITIVVNDDRMYVSETLKAIKSKVLEELNYGLAYTIIGKNVLMSKTEGLKSLLNDGEILFDKTGETTLIKSSVFKDKTQDAVTYQPALNIRG